VAPTARRSPGLTDDAGGRRLTIDLDGPGSEPTGWASNDEGARVQFDGWLQLLAALEHAIGAEPAVLGASQPAPGGETGHR
jgi:hypothetical protein